MSEEEVSGGVTYEMVPVQRPHEGALTIASARSVAEACREIVKATVVRVGGGQHIGIEGWLAIAGQHGCTISSQNVRRVETGYAAEGVVKNADGRVLSVAEGFVGDDERMWKNRDEYAKRGMAQTRAMSRAARNVFAHVVVAMKAGFSTTPAEEMLHETPGPSPKFLQIRSYLYEKRGEERLRELAEKLSELVDSGEITRAEELSLRDVVNIQLQLVGEKSATKESEGAA